MKFRNRVKTLRLGERGRKLSESKPVKENGTAKKNSLSKNDQRRFRRKHRTPSSFRFFCQAYQSKTPFDNFDSPHISKQLRNGDAKADQRSSLQIANLPAKTADTQTPADGHGRPVPIPVNTLQLSAAHQNG